MNKESYCVLAPIVHRHADRGHQLVINRLLRLVAVLFAPSLLPEASILLQIEIFFISVIEQEALLLLLALALLPQPVGDLRVGYIGVHGCPDSRMGRTI